MCKSVLCPYCGHKMTSRMLCHSLDRFKGWYECDKCGSTSPKVEYKGNSVQTQFASRAAALRRFTPSEEIRKAVRIWGGYI